MLIRCLLLLTAVSLMAHDEAAFAMKLYASQRAHQQGDLLTVVVDESMSSLTREDLNTSKSMSAQAEASLGDAAGGRISRELARVDIPGYDLGAGSEFTGAGAQTTRETFAVTFTVRVIDVLANGVMLVEGSRELQLKDEKVQVKLTGLVRPNDINKDNIVLSSRLSDARLVYHRTGEVSRGSRPGWLWRVFQAINPF